MSYRKIYSEITGVEVPIYFDVHHIDFDRNNNDIENMVALPKKLHSDYHKHLPYLNYGLPTQLSILNIGYINLLTDYINIHIQCSKWINHRDYLLNKSPNIYNLSYLKWD